MDTIEVKSFLRDEKVVLERIMKMGGRLVEERGDEDAYYMCANNCSLKVKETKNGSNIQLIEPVARGVFRITKIGVKEGTGLKYALGKALGLKLSVRKRVAHFRLGKVDIYINSVKGFGKVIIYEGVDRKSLMALARSMGTTDFLEKPFDDVYLEKMKR